MIIKELWSIQLEEVALVPSSVLCFTTPGPPPGVKAALLRCVFPHQVIQHNCSLAQRLNYPAELHPEACLLGDPRCCQDENHHTFCLTSHLWPTKPGQVISHGWSDVVTFLDSEKHQRGLELPDSQSSQQRQWICFFLCLPCVSSARGGAGERTSWQPHRKPSVREGRV